MRVLLTGASGFIGSALRAALSARGDDVVSVSRAPGDGEVGFDTAARRLDFSRLPGGVLGHLDASVHLAGAPIVTRWTTKRIEEIRASRITLGEIIARQLAGLDEPPRVHVTGSAVGYYGDRGEEAIDEDSSAGSGILPSLCGAWENATEPARAAGIRTVAVRSGIVIGNGGLVSRLVPLYRAGLGGRLGSGRQWTAWISLADEVSAIMAALSDETLSGPLNAVSPQPVRNEEMTGVITRAVGRKARLPVPSFALRSVFGRGPADEVLLASARAMPQKLSGIGFSFAEPDLAAAVARALE